MRPTGTMKMKMKGRSNIGNMGSTPGRDTSPVHDAHPKGSLQAGKESRIVCVHGVTSTFDRIPVPAHARECPSRSSTTSVVSLFYSAATRLGAV
jgi:hypothetical protein